MSVGQARHHVAGARLLEEARREIKQVREHGATHVGDDSLAQPGHQIETHIRGARHHHDHAEQSEQRLIQRRGIAAREAHVDDALEPLADDQKAARGDHQRHGSADHLPAVRRDEAPQDAQVTQALQPRARFGCDG